MPPVQFITHNDTQILLMDLSNACSTAELTKAVDEIKKVVAMHRPYIRYIALVGLGFFRSMAFRLMLRLSGKTNHRVFGSPEKALEWLGEKCNLFNHGIC
jgi:hypothetical protein